MRWKQTRKKGLLTLCVAMAMMLSISGCGSDKTETAMNQAVSMDSAMNFNSGGAAMGGDVFYSEMASESEPMESGTADAMKGDGSTGNTTSSAFADTNRKLIRTVNLDLETQEFDTLMNTLTEQVSDLGGYVQSMETYNGSRYSGRVSVRNAYLTVRIPKAKLDGFLETVSNVGNVVRRSENVQDVTLSYVDLESHKKVLEAEQERLLAFLEQATTVEEMIALEERLSNVRYQIESMEAQLRTYDNQVDYSTVHIDIEEVKELTEVPVEEPSRLEILTKGFMDSLKDVGEGILDFGIWVIIHLPYFAVWALVIAGIVGFIKLMIRRSKKKRAKKMAKLAETAKADEKTKSNAEVKTEK